MCIVSVLLHSFSILESSRYTSSWRGPQRICSKKSSLFWSTWFYFLFEYGSCLFCFGHCDFGLVRWCLVIIGHVTPTVYNLIGSTSGVYSPSQQRYRRETVREIKGLGIHDYPRSRPYDINNTDTKLILLNNKVHQVGPMFWFDLI